MGLGDSTLTELSSFSKVLLPTLSAAAAASGAIASSAAKYAATALFMDVLITVSSGILMPVIYAFIAACIAEAAVGGEGITGAASFLKWMATTLLTLIVLAFVVYLGVSGVVSSATDAATLRVAKTTLSTVFPVVGSIISDAASSVLAGASVLRNAIGVFGMLAVISLCLLPFMHLGAHYILYKAVSKLTATVSGSKISKLVSGIGTAFGLTMSLTGACALMLFFSLISMIKVVTPG
jgi:stage III sporulation protein AE